MACDGCARARGLVGDSDAELTRQVAAFLREHEDCGTALRIGPRPVPDQRRPSACEA